MTSMNSMRWSTFLIRAFWETQKRSRERFRSLSNNHETLKHPTSKKRWGSRLFTRQALKACCRLEGSDQQNSKRGRQLSFFDALTRSSEHFCLLGLKSLFSFHWQMYSWAVIWILLLVQHKKVVKGLPRLSGFYIKCGRRVIILL